MRSGSDVVADEPITAEPRRPAPSRVKLGRLRCLCEVAGEVERDVLADGSVSGEGDAIELEGGVAEGDGSAGVDGEGVGAGGGVVLSRDVDVMGDAVDSDGVEEACSGSWVLGNFKLFWSDLP